MSEASEVGWDDPDSHAYIGDGTHGCVVCQYPMNAHADDGQRVV